MRDGAERQDLVLFQALGNYPQMHALFFSYKAISDCHEIDKELWLPSERFYLNLYNRLLKVSDCHESLCKQLVKG